MDDDVAEEQYIGISYVSGFEVFSFSLILDLVTGKFSGFVGLCGKVLVAGGL